MEDKTNRGEAKTSLKSLKRGTVKKWPVRRFAILIHNGHSQKKACKRLRIAERTAKKIRETKEYQDILKEFEELDKEFTQKLYKSTQFEMVKLINRQVKSGVQEERIITRNPKQTKVKIRRQMKVGDLLKLYQIMGEYNPSYTHNHKTESESKIDHVKILKDLKELKDETE